MTSVWRVLLASLTLAFASTAAASAQRIVTLAPNLTELVFAAGAGERVVGAVEFSDYPEAALRIPRVGNAFRVDQEKILALHPDLVLAWESGTPTAVVERLRALGLEVAVVQVSRVSQVSDALRKIGNLVGSAPAADSAARDFENRLAALRASYANRKLLRVFIEIDRQPLFTVNGQHVISEIVDLCGGQNIFSDIGQLAPSIGMEAVLVKDPQVILSTVHDATGLQEDWQRWNKVSAVRDRHIYQMNPDILARSTPRLLEGAGQVCEVLERARDTITRSAKP